MAELKTTAEQRIARLNELYLAACGERDAERVRIDGLLKTQRELIATRDMLRAENKRLREAIKQKCDDEAKALVDLGAAQKAVAATVEVVHSWHGDEGWEIYRDNCPELELARAVRVETEGGSDG